MNLDIVQKSLQGKKTYFAAAIGILYLVGVWAGFWAFDEKILAFFGLGALAFLRAGVKKAELLVLLTASLVVGATGCARFSTTQTDQSYDTTGNKQRAVTTRAAAWTFFSGQSQLTQWKASQTDKTQGATVGGLEQTGGQTNQVNDIVGAVVGAAVKAAASAAKP